MPRTPLLTAASALLVALGCSHTQAVASLEPVGCWYFERDDAATALQLPWGIRLGDDQLTGWPALDQRGGARAAATLTPDGEQGHPFGYWMDAPGDSIEVGYPAGGGLTLRLSLGDTALHGTAHPAGDALPAAADRTPHAVVLTRAACLGSR